MKGKAGGLSEALRGRWAGPCRLFLFQESVSAHVGPLRIQRDALKTVDGQCHPPSRRQGGRQTSESRRLRHAGQKLAQDHEEETQSGPCCPSREKDRENARQPGALKNISPVVRLKTCKRLKCMRKHRGRQRSPPFGWLRKTRRLFTALRVA